LVPEISHLLLPVEVFGVVDAGLNELPENVEVVQEKSDQDFDVLRRQLV
jgi:hypothetical protein